MAALRLVTRNCGRFLPALTPAFYSAAFLPSTTGPFPCARRPHDDLLELSVISRHFSKKSGGKANAPITPEGFSLKHPQELMEKAIEHLKTELTGVRPGRASPGMLDHLTVVAYGDKMPMKAVGTVSVKDPQMLGVSVFDPETAEAVAKAIRECPMALNPSVEGSEVLVPIPRPTREGLAGMAKMVAKEAEKCKVGSKNAVGTN